MPLTEAGRDAIAALITGGGTPFNAANSHIGVGDSSTAFAATQTDLQAATNKFREIVDGAPSVVGNVITFVATFEGPDANFAWQEFGIFNDPSAGTMLVRKVANHGTKGSGDVWEMTVDVTVAIGS